MTKPTKSNDMRNQLRNLMNQHTATVSAKPPVSIAVLMPEVPKPQAPPPKPTLVTPPQVPVRIPTETPRSASANVPPPAHAINQVVPHADRCTVRLTGSEMANINQLILETHQRTGERITSSDVLRIALSRVGAGTPIAASEIKSLRDTDGRRMKYRV